MPIQGRLDDAALNTASATVHQTNFAESGVGGRLDVLLDNRRNVARIERVEVDFGFDGNANRLGHFRLPTSNFQAF